MAFNAKGTFWTTGSGSVTPGTGVAAQAAHTTYAATAPLFVINNTAATVAPGSTPNASIWPAYLRLILTTVPASTLSLNCVIRHDTGSLLPTNSNQYTTPTPVNGDSRDSSSASVCRFYHYLNAQAMVTPAESGAAKTVYRSRINTGLGIAGDEYIFLFNQQNVAWQQKSGASAVRATDPARLTGHGTGFCIAPGTWAKIHLYWTTEGSASGFETEFGWYELA